MSEEQEKAMKRENPVKKALGGIATGACLVGLGWLSHNFIKPPEKEQAKPPAAATPLVEVCAVESSALNPPLTYIGHVEPIQDVELRAQIDGYVQTVHFQEGALVQAGDLLFSIDAEQYEARVAVREAEIAQAEAALERAESYLRRLEASDARAISQMDLDTAKSDVAQGRAAVKQAQANLALAAIDLKHTKIIAPISGLVGRTAANVGDYVSPSLGTLVRIVQIDPIRVAFSVADREYVKMRESLDGGTVVQDKVRVRLRLPTGTIPDIEGQPDFEDNMMSLGTATLSVRTRFSNKKGLLIPGAYVTVLVDEASPKAMPTIPQESIKTDKSGTYVFVVDDADKVERRNVKIGITDNGRATIEEGLETGERIVVQGLQRAVHGEVVQIAAPKKEVTGI